MCHCLLFGWFFSIFFNVFGFDAFILSWKIFKMNLWTNRKPRRFFSWSRCICCCEECSPSGIACARLAPFFRGNSTAFSVKRNAFPEKNKEQKCGGRAKRNQKWSIWKQSQAKVKKSLINKRCHQLPKMIRFQMMLSSSKTKNHHLCP